MIAIVGMDGRWPGADTLEQFWQNLRAGVEALGNGTGDTAPPDDVIVREHERFVPSVGALRACEWFDAGFFGISPREADILDPQHRHFLECCWHALEHAGYNPLDCGGAVGVFGGMSMSTYLLHVAADPALRQIVGGTQMVTSNDKDFLATRVSYKLNLSGPSVSVQTACSTSLVAVHLASQALLNGECDMALAGGGSRHDGRPRAATSTGRATFCPPTGIAARSPRTRPAPFRAMASASSS